MSHTNQSIGDQNGTSSRASISFKYKLGNTPIVRLYGGTMWAEGCAWSGVGRYLAWSDIPNNEQLRWCEEDGHVGRRFHYPAGNSNGNTL